MKWPHFSSAVAHVYESLIHAGGKQHRNREHYSEIKVDLKLLPHHLARAAGKSKRCRKWMNSQPGWFRIAVFINTCYSRYLLCTFQYISPFQLLLLLVFKHFDHIECKSTTEVCLTLRNHFSIWKMGDLN